MLKRRDVKESSFEPNSKNAYRSILDNPKLNHKTMFNPDVKEGFITPFWRKRMLRFYKSLIPSHTPQKNQVWLNSSRDILDFIDKLKDPDCDLSFVEYVCILGTISDVYDVIDFFTDLKKKLPEHAKIIYSNYNWRWEYFFKLSGLVGFSQKSPWGNYYRDDDLDCFLKMAGWENVQRMNRYILPFEWKGGGTFLDGLVRLPIFRAFTLNTIFIARKSNEEKTGEHSVTVLIPCKNEEDNIEAIVKRMPEFGKSVELIFINDRSTDGTEGKILSCMKEFPSKNIRLVQGLGQGKGEAIRAAMNEAKGDICMILDADLSVIPEDLPQFYEALNTRRADFINGTRMVYPQENEAMRPANILGNFAFSVIFSYILGQRITDTLCGTKVFWKKDWPLFEEMRLFLKNKDIWGDYNLIFGAARFGLKIGELPVRYFQRLKGITKMTKRIKNGLIMLRVAWYAFWEIKFFN